MAWDLPTCAVNGRGLSPNYAVGFNRPWRGRLSRLMFLAATPRAAPTRTSTTLLARFFIAMIRLYQRTLSPLLGNVCRFEPSCSRYAVECLTLHGAGRGSLLSILRLCKCHPFHAGGYDPPPLPGAPGRIPTAAKAFLEAPVKKA
jgi:putative membrane protein insertion efficiency factor